MARPTLRLYDGTASTSPQLKDAVKELQTLLKNYGYKVKIDGEYGPYTESVVKLFQSAKGLIADGVAGPQTWSALLNKPEPQDLEMAFQTSYAKWDKDLLRQLEELKKYEDIIKKVASAYGIPASVIAAIGSRESSWGLGLTPPGPAGTSADGHGRGLMQIDDRWHVPFVQSGKWADAKENIVYGAAVLKNSIEFIVKKLSWPMGYRLLKAGLAGFNCGPARVLQAIQNGYDEDFYTAGRNYAKDILERAGWFQMHGWS